MEAPPPTQGRRRCWNEAAPMVLPTQRNGDGRGWRTEETQYDSPVTLHLLESLLWDNTRAILLCPGLPQTVQEELTVNRLTKHWSQNYYY